MFSLDDHTGNVVTTVALFLVAATILYMARDAVLVLLLSLLFAYLLKPGVTLVQKHSLICRGNRTWAIAVVYLIAAVLLVGLAYEFGPYIATQMKSLIAALPSILAGLSSGDTAGGLGDSHGLRAAQLMKVRGFIADHHEFIVSLLERATASAAQAAASAIWLFAVPIISVFLLRDGRQIANAMIDVAERRWGQRSLRRILQRVDTMLAKYMLAQLALAGLSFLFYSASMLALKFPYALALGVLGGALEFLPTVGWLASSAIILTVGFLVHAHWVWMAVLLVLWRLVQDYVNSPRIMGKNLELQPLTVVFALMVGGQVGGIMGMYLSVPIIAVLRIVWLEGFSAPNSSTLRSDQPPDSTAESKA